MARRKHQHRPLSPALLLLLPLLLLGACDAPQTTFSPVSDTAESLHTVYILVTIMAGIVMAGVLGIMVYILIRFRARPGRDAIQIHGSTKLEIAWTLAPVAVLTIIGIPSVLAIARAAEPPGPDALEIRIVGHQWWWEVQYPGLGPEDPANPGQRLPLMTANEIHLPLGKEASFKIEAADVIHSFWVPQLAGKIDAVPGRVNTLPPFTPLEVGVYYGQCAEFCGTAHAQMRFRVVVESLGDFNRWIEALQTPPTPVTGLATQGESLFVAKGCIACHTIAGVPAAAGRTGPNLTLLGSRLTLGAGIMANTDENLRDWITDPRELKPGVLLMPSFGTLATDNPQYMSAGEITAVSAYLRSLTVE